MKRFVLHAVLRLLPLIILLLCVSACDMGGGQGRASSTPQHAPTPTPTAGILLGPQPCPEQVRSASYWEAFVHPTTTQQIEKVICGYLMGQPTLQAVVTVRTSGTDRLLDLHVFTHLTGASPTTIFSLTGMHGGEAIVSNYNTLLTHQEEWLPFQNEQIRHTLAREFKWSDSAHMLVQVGFVGLYPDLSRYDAETTQAQVNVSQGDRGWQLDAVSTAQSFAEALLHWPSGSPTTVISGGGTHDARAEVQVTNAAVNNATVQVSLSRLELNTNGGIWEVTDVASNGLSFTAPQGLQQIASPAQVSGSASLRAGEHAVLALLNEERASLVQKTLRLSTPGTAATFNTSVTYTSSSFQGMVQEGILVLYTFTSTQQIAGCVMEKVLLQN